MAKNIVICCDGTGNEFGESKSNVVKLYKMLVYDAWRRRWIAPSSLVHTSVERRLADKSLSYTPSNLPAERLTSGDVEKLLANRIAGQEV
jgi:uncharacterized protein (DUF2235 family)